VSLQRKFPHTHSRVEHWGQYHRSVRHPEDGIQSHVDEYSESDDEGETNGRLHPFFDEGDQLFGWGYHQYSPDETMKGKQPGEMLWDDPRDSRTWSRRTAFAKYTALLHYRAAVVRKVGEEMWAAAAGLKPMFDALLLNAGGVDHDRPQAHEPLSFAHRAGGLERPVYPLDEFTEQILFDSIVAEAGSQGPLWPVQGILRDHSDVGETRSGTWSPGESFCSSIARPIPSHAGSTEHTWTGVAVVVGPSRASEPNVDDDDISMAVLFDGNSHTLLDCDCQTNCLCPRGPSVVMDLPVKTFERFGSAEIYEPGLQRLLYLGWQQFLGQIDQEGFCDAHWYNSTQGTREMIKHSCISRMGYGDPRAWEDDMIDDGHVLWEGLPRDTSADSWKVTAKGKKLWDDFERYVNHLPEERPAIDEHGHDWRYEIIPWCGHRCLPGIAGSNYINNGQHEYHAVCPNVKSTGSLNHELGMGVWSHCAGCTARALTTAADIAQFAAEHPKPPESGHGRLCGPRRTCVGFGGTASPTMRARRCLPQLNSQQKSHKSDC
jgi:hypothetical protein